MALRLRQGAPVSGVAEITRKALGEYTWRLEPHVCSACLGRVLGRQTPSGKEHRCSNCGSAWAGSLAAGCACGMKIGTRNAGVRCVPNPDQRPELLCEIIVKEIKS